MPPRPFLPIARIVLLALALVLAQALGLVHGAVHWGGAADGTASQAAHATGGGAHASEAQPAHAHAGPAHASDTPTEPPGHWAAHLFGGHVDGGLDCRLYDPHLNEGPPSVAALALPLALAGVYLAACQGEFLARWVALFDARGPPARS